jgi:hypothetical protein
LFNTGEAASGLSIIIIIIIIIFCFITIRRRDA